MKHSDKRQKQRRIDKAIKAAIQAIEAGEYEALSFEDHYRTCGHAFVSAREVQFKIFIDVDHFDYFDFIKGPGFSLNHDESEKYDEVIADLDKWEYLLEAEVKG